jgi:hypothetical protein
VGRPWTFLSMPLMAISDLSDAGGPAFFVVTGAWPGQRTSPPCPGMNPCGTRVRLTNAASRRTDTHGRLRQRCEIRFITAAIIAHSVADGISMYGRIPWRGRTQKIAFVTFAWTQERMAGITHAKTC